MALTDSKKPVIKSGEHLAHIPITYFNAKLLNLFASDNVEEELSSHMRWKLICPFCFTQIICQANFLPRHERPTEDSNPSTAGPSCIWPTPSIASCLKILDRHFTVIFLVFMVF